MTNSSRNQNDGAIPEQREARADSLKTVSRGRRRTVLINLLSANLMLEYFQSFLIFSRKGQKE